MPRLKSGRHVALSASPLLDQLKFGTDVRVSALILALRLTVTSPIQLRDFLTIGYFREGEGTPPNAPSYNSGLLVRDVLEGKAGWSLEEIEEFKEWLDSNREINAWLLERFEEINAAIRDNLVWETPLWNGDEPRKPDQ